MALYYLAKRLIDSRQRLVWFLGAIIVAAVIVYVIAKVVANVRKSEQQWQQVDKSKLREWDDEDDWGD